MSFSPLLFQPFRSDENDMIEYLEMSFVGAPREIRRIVLRSATDTSVDKIEAGKLTFYNGDITSELEFRFEAEDVCILHFNLANANEATQAVAYNADKLRMDVTSVFRDVKGRTGFKMDVFLNEITLAPPTNSTSIGE